MRLRVGVATDIGRVREKNEDSYLVEEPLFAVADGMGGHKGGDVASQLALETIEGEPAADLAQRLRDANAAVFERSQSDRSVTGMGTTVTAVVVEGTSALFAHVGDSRAYLLRAGDLRQLTDDHTLVARMVKTGEITEAEAEVHPHRSVLTRALGTEPDVIVDEFDVALTDGDRLLLCSDGLTGMVTEEQIVAILSAAPDPQDAANRLVRAANRAGGVDNITVVVIDVEAEDGEDTDGPPRARDPEPPAAAARCRPDRAGAVDPRRRRHRRCACTWTGSGTWASPAAASPCSAGSRPSSRACTSATRSSSPRSRPPTPRPSPSTRSCRRASPPTTARPR